MINSKNRLKGHLRQSKDGVTGIQQAVASKKMMKRMEKINMLADGVAMGEMKSKIFGLDN
jgi:hypothetical protein